MKRLRSRKCREEKPLALMVRDLETARRLAEIGDAEEASSSPPRSGPSSCSSAGSERPSSPPVAPGMETLGIMLPYTPLQHLLLAGDLPVLVMTSANRTDEPICIGNREALQRLRGIADAFLVHNRDILVRCDDSVAHGGGEEPRSSAPLPGVRPQTGRPAEETTPRSWPWAPRSSHLCILKRGFAFLSPHIGDLETPRGAGLLPREHRPHGADHRMPPGRVACDLHPGYYTSRAASG